MRFWERGISKKKYRANGGFTLVELIVSMALTAILATAVASLMFPVVSIFLNMQKLSRAQMVADTVTDALRKECASAYVTGVMDVRVFDLPNPTKATFGDQTMLNQMLQEKEAAVAWLDNPTGGNILVLRINEGYEKALYWNVGISTKNYKDLLTSYYKIGLVTSKAVYRLFPKGTDNLTDEKMPMETRPGYLHCAYYATTVQNVKRDEKDIAVYYPGETYDYTNPFTVAAYNGFTVSITYSEPVYETIVKDSTFVADKRPVCVTATIKVYESDYAKQSEDTLVYSREAVLCFAEDNKR